MRSTQEVPAVTMRNATSHANVNAHETADTCDYNLHIVTNFKHCVIPINVIALLWFCLAVIQDQ